MSDKKQPFCFFHIKAGKRLGALEFKSTNLYGILVPEY